MRVYELAKELGKDAGDFLEELNGNFGFEIKSHLSGISKEQIDSWGVKYHELLLGKPRYDIFVDDRAINNEEWYKQNKIEVIN